MTKIGGFSGLLDHRKGRLGIFYSHEANLYISYWLSVCYIENSVYWIFLLKNLKFVFGVEYFVKQWMLFLLIWGQNRKNITVFWVDF